jgi:hypothetical protein
MRKLLAATAMLTLLPLSAAYAQDKGPATVRSDSEKKKSAEIEKAYKETIARQGKTPTAPVDPWQNVRPPANDNTKQR